MDQAALTLLERARTVADTILAPAAERVDITGVIPPSHFDALADAGLFGILGPLDAGGSDDRRRWHMALGRSTLGCHRADRSTRCGGSCDQIAGGDRRSR